MARRATAVRASREPLDERPAIEAAQRDPRHFAELYEKNFERIYAYVARRVRDRTVAEDLTSDVFHEALRNLPRFEWRGVPFAAWLFKIASNAIIDHAQRAARSRRLELDPPKQASLEDAERRARLFRMVGKLPSDQQHVIVLRFAEQRSIREIAQQLRRSEGAVKQLQFRGLANLRTLMGKAHG